MVEPYPKSMCFRQELEFSFDDDMGGLQSTTSDKAVVITAVSLGPWGHSGQNEKDSPSWHLESRPDGSNSKLIAERR